jgi:hypothetical protein
MYLRDTSVASSAVEPVAQVAQVAQNRRTGVELYAAYVL